MAKKAKKVENLVKLQIPAGQANPSPPVGPALGQAGLNIMEFCNAFNSQTANSEPGVLIPVGPPPTITKLRYFFLIFSSFSFSAFSNAFNIFSRISRASFITFNPLEKFAHSLLPKYNC